MCPPGVLRPVLLTGGSWFESFERVIQPRSILRGSGLARSDVLLDGGLFTAPGFVVLVEHRSRRAHARVVRGERRGRFPVDRATVGEEPAEPARAGRRE